MQGIVGRLIRFGQWLNGNGYRDYEHAFVYIGDGLIVEAQPGGAVVSPLSRYDGRRLLWSTDKVSLSDEQRKAIVEAAMGFVGTPYNFLDYVYLALKRVGIKIPILTKRVVESRHMICSQLDIEAWRAGHEDPYPGKLSCEVTPADLASLWA